MIPPSSFDLLDGNSSDIFSYFREYYHTDNPHDSGFITINASSTTLDLEEEKEQNNVSILISTPGEDRWVSQQGGDQYFTINFHRNSVDLLGYSIETSSGYRYIKSWDLYGIINTKLVLIDHQRDQITCPNHSTLGSVCKQDAIAQYRCSNPGVFHKFKFVLAGNDSMNEAYLSMTRLRFFGTLNPYVFYQTQSTHSNHITQSLIYLFCLFEDAH